MSYLKRERKHIFYSIVLGLTGSLVGISIFGLSGYMISLSFFDPPIFIIILIIAVIKLFGMIKGAFKYFERLLSHDATFRLIGRLRLKYFKDTMHQNRNTHSVRFIQTLNQYFEQIEDYYIRIIYPYVIAVLLAVLLVILAVVIDWKLALLMVFVSVLSLYLLPKLFESKMYRISESSLLNESGAYMKVYHHIHNYIDLFVNRQDSVSEASVSASFTEIQNDRIRKSGLESFQLFLSGLIQWAGILAVIILMAQGNGLLVPMVLLLLIGFFDVANPVILPRTNYRSVAAAVKDVSSEIESVPVVEKQDNIALNHIDFRYPGTKKNVLDDINIKVNQGEKHVIIGSSGAGKTTILNRMIGQVNAGVMPQHLDFYHADIRDNVTMFGHFSALDETIEKMLDGFEMEYLNLDETIDYTGHLSGGERKRLHLIRMMIENKSWWLLDEPTASLNETLKDKVWDMIFERETIVVSTHDLSRLHQFDYIHFIESGRIIEQGSYEQLMNQEGAVRQAVRRFADNL